MILMMSINRHANTLHYIFSIVNTLMISYYYITSYINITLISKDISINETILLDGHGSKASIIS